VRGGGSRGEPGVSAGKPGSVRQVDLSSSHDGMQWAESIVGRHGHVGLRANKRRNKRKPAEKKKVYSTAYKGGRGRRISKVEPGVR